MALRDVLAKFRHIDNLMSRWIIRHFYMIFFEILLVVVFVFLFIITIKVIDASLAVSPHSIIERLLLLQSVNSIIIVFLMLLNTFWMLYVFNSIIRMRSLLREINFNLLKKKN